MGAGKPVSGNPTGNHAKSKNAHQKYQNKVAFHHNPGSKLTKKILASAVTGLCGKCREIIEWRKRYRKYKPLTVAKRCVQCEQKRITEAYHVLCTPCATAAGVCAKCREAAEILDDGAAPDPAAVQRDLQAAEQLLRRMPERLRRTYRRRLDQGDQSAASALLERFRQHAGDESDDDFSGLSDTGSLSGSGGSDSDSEPAPTAKGDCLR